MRECEKGQEAGEGAQSPQGHHKLFRTLPTVIKCLHWGALPSPHPALRAAHLGACAAP